MILVRENPHYQSLTHTPNILLPSPINNYHTPQYKTLTHPSMTLLERLQADGNTSRGLIRGSTCDSKWNLSMRYSRTTIWRHLSQYYRTLTYHHLTHSILQDYNIPSFHSIVQDYRYVIILDYNRAIAYISQSVSITYYLTQTITYLYIALEPPSHSVSHAQGGESNRGRGPLLTYQAPNGESTQIRGIC